MFSEYLMQEITITLGKFRTNISKPYSKIYTSPHQNKISNSNLNFLWDKWSQNH